MTTFVLPTAQEMEAMLKHITPNASIEITELTINRNDETPYFDIVSGYATYRITGDVILPNNRPQMEEIVSVIKKKLDFKNERAVGWAKGACNYFTAVLAKKSVYAFVDIFADQPSVIVIRYDQKLQKQDPG